MRIESGRSRVIVVHPGDAERKFAARLTWVPGSELGLEFDLDMGDVPEWLNRSRTDRLIIVEPEPATLFDILTNDSSISKPTAHYRQSISWALFGREDRTDIPRFTRMDVEIDGCASWFGVHGFKRIDGLDKISSGIFIEYHSPSTLYWDVGEGLQVGYGINTRFNRTRRPNETLNIEESPRISVRSVEPLEARDLLRIATKAMAFVEFATDETVWIDRVHVGARDGAVRPEYEMAALWKQERTKSSGIHWLFPFQAVGANFGDHLKRWFELYDQMPLALDLYRITQRSSGLEAEFRFFSIISAVESLHRTVFGDGTVHKCPTCKMKKSMSLEQRLRDLVKRYGTAFGDLLRAKDCKLVADTRNYLAHQTPDLRLKSIPPDDWFDWYRRLAIVFEFTLLAEMPFQQPSTLKAIVDGRWAGIKSGLLGEWSF